MFLVLFCLLHTLLVSSTNGFNITQVLSQYPDFKTFNDHLTQTQVADQISGRDTVTVLAVDNAGMSPLSGKPRDVIKMVMSIHVVLDYYDVQKLQRTQNKTVMLTTLYQTTGQAKGQTGFLKATILDTGSVAIGSAEGGSNLNSNLIRSVFSSPYNVSVLQVSGVITPPDVGPSPTPPAPIPRNPPRNPTGPPAKPPVPSGAMPMPPGGGKPPPMGGKTPVPAPSHNGGTMPPPPMSAKGPAPMMGSPPAPPGMGGSNNSLGAPAPTMPSPPAPPGMGGPNNSSRAPTPTMPSPPVPPGAVAPAPAGTTNSPAANDPAADTPKCDTGAANNNNSSAIMDAVCSHSLVIFMSLLYISWFSFMTQNV